MTDTTTRQAAQDRIQTLQAQLEAEQEKLRQFDQLTPLQQFATDIHALTCHQEHTETCGWFYEKWDNAATGNMWTRQRYLEKAERLLTITDAATALAVLAEAEKF